MARSAKPILSVLVDEEKKKKFAVLAERYSLSMGWLLNQAIDKMLDADSIHVYRDSIEPIEPTSKPAVTTDGEYVKKSDIEDEVKNLLSDYAKRSSLSGLVTHKDLQRELKFHPDIWQFEELQKAVEALDAKKSTPRKPAIETASKQPTKVDRNSTYGKECLNKLEVIKHKPAFLEMAIGLVREEGLSGVPLAEKLNKAGFIKGMSADTGNKINATIRLHLEDLEAAEATTND